MRIVNEWLKDSETASSSLIVNVAFFRNYPKMSQLTQDRERRDNAPRPTADDWSHPVESHPILDGLGYVWHPKLKILICLGCRAAVSPGSLEMHSKIPGHTFAVEEVRKFVNELAEGCVFGDREGRVPLLKPDEKLVAWPYLNGGNAYRCPECSRCYEKMDSVKRHHRQKHGNTSVATFEKVRCQELFKGQGRSRVWVPIEGDEESMETDIGSEVATLAQAMQLQLAQHLQGAFQVDWKVKDAWAYLKVVPWHTVLEANQDEYETAELRAMVTIPPMYSEEARNTFPAKLAIFIQKWILGWEWDVRQADYRLKQLLGADSAE